MTARGPDADLERALVELRSSIAFPEGVDVATAVRDRLEAHGPLRAPALLPLRRRFEASRARRPVIRPVWQQVAAVAAAVLFLFGAVVGASPTARRAVADFLGLRGVRIESVPSPSISVPVGGDLRLGERVALDEAQARVPFRIRIPQDPMLGEPDEVYVSSLAAGVPQVFLVWRARPGLPEASSTGAGLVLSEFRAEVDQQLIEKKVLPGTGTAVEAVDVRGSPGFWISGRPHLLVFLDEFGRVIEDQVRLAGNVLLWEAGEVTLRLEAAITREVAVRIAETVR